jgi:stage II sporulation protein R
MALLFAFLVVTALWAEVQQGDLADKVIRLHVLANSDSGEDQALKLAVRDQIMAQVEPLLSQAQSAQEAADLLQADLDHLEEVAAREIEAQGYQEDVRVVLEETWFPTRQDGELSLPAGRYQALRVLIGAAEGQNWWCVVFPSLCQETGQEEALPAAGLTQGQVSLLTEENAGYVIRFKAMEWWEMWKHWAGG